MKKIALIAFLFCSTLIIAQVNVQAYLDSSEIYIGDQIRLNLELNNLESEAKASADLAPLDTLSGIEVLKVEPWIRESDGGTSLHREILITSFDSGYHWIPGIQIQVETDDKTLDFTTDAIPLLVRFVPLDSLILAPIKDIDKEPLNWQDFKPYVLLLAIILLILTAIYLYNKISQRKQPEDTTEEFVLPAYLVALEKLEKLKASKLWQQGLIVDYQSELTYILREYIEKKFGILALESTTDELLALVKSIDLEESQIADLRETLQLADLVKFAKAQPSIEVHDTIMDFASQFILATKDWQPVIENEFEEEE